MAYPNFKNRPKNGLRPLGVKYIEGTPRDFSNDLPIAISLMTQKQLNF
jgi:hypothetical protein